ncbi:Fic family protein [Leifsonia shinshuensis]|uniref:Fic family protein n=2 Tax=Leifsonia shinshuensis TaxID=150026 RepID=A0A7G6Y8R9_9MICO|nr:Fic family protein [Leifsonia shinshuensis]
MLMSGIGAWPTLTREQFAWRSRYSREHLTQRQWEASRGPYDAAVAPPIAELDVPVGAAVAADAAEAAGLLTRFDTEFGLSVLPFASILLRSESASSSQIENLTSGARAIAETELGERDTGNAPLIVRNVHAMQAALELSDALDGGGIIAMHAALLEDHAPELTGGYRREQVWIGGSGVSPHGAAFVPPHHERVPAAMGDLVAFMGRWDIPALVHAAVAHAQFETIHPFPDGNGRTGRAIVQAMLRRSRTTSTVVVPVSAGLLHDVDGYYDALTAYRAGDLDPIVRAFTEAAAFAVRTGRELATSIAELRARWEDALIGLRSDSSARRVAVLALEQPVLNAAVVEARLGLSAPGTYRAFEALVDRGVLRPANSRKRNRLWIADDMIQALDDFADRAARRSVR